MTTSTSTLGWSDEKRRQEIKRIYAHLVDDRQLSRAHAIALVQRRTGYNLNTIQGWFTVGAEITRALPSCMLLDVLRYELGLATPLDLITWGKRKESQTQQENRKRSVVKSVSKLKDRRPVRKILALPGRRARAR